MRTTNNRPTKVVTGKVRFSYVNIFYPRASIFSKDSRYSLSLIIDKEDKETLGRIYCAMEAAKEEGNNLWGGSIPENLILPLKNGSLHKEPRKEYENKFYINTSSKLKPGVVDNKLTPITDASVVYSGCYGRVSLNFYPYEQGDIKGIGCALLNVQMLEQGETLGAHSKPEEDFEAIEKYENDFLD
jgi:hypothetical protein